MPVPLTLPPPWRTPASMPPAALTPLRLVPLRLVPLRLVPLRLVPFKLVPLRLVPLRLVPFRLVPLSARTSDSISPTARSDSITQPASRSPPRLAIASDFIATQYRHVAAARRVLRG